MPTETKKYNPSLGGAFSNNAFGEGSILLNITAENLKTLVENVQVGSAILLRYNKETIKGNKHYFTEVIPPMGKGGSSKTSKGTGKDVATTDLD